MHLKFSLRTLFLTTTIVAAVCYWLVLPTLKAQRFVRAVASEHYKLADAYFRNQGDQFLFDWNEKHWRFKAEAGLEEWSLPELLRGERRVRLRVIYGDAGPMRTRAWTVVATRNGLLQPEPAFSGGVSGIAI
jgi:hypothetical protein